MTDYKPCLYESMSNQDYHSPRGLSRSAIWKFKKLPYRYWYEYLSGEFTRPEPTEAMKFGTLCHTVLLEPEKFDEEYLVMDKINRRKKEGQVAYAKALEEAGNREIIMRDNHEAALAIRDSVMSNEVARDILSNGKAEQSIFWKDEVTGIELKARPDWMNGPIIADFKTALDAGYHGFQRAAYNDGYFLQAAMILEACKAIGHEVVEFVFICSEKKPPYSTALYRLDEESIDFGRKMLRNLLDDYARCLEKKEWPGYGIQTLLIPRYATMENEYEQAE